MGEDVPRSASFASSRPVVHTGTKSYKRDKVLGRGAYGLVYVCTRESDGEQVVEKEIVLRGLEDAEKEKTMKEVNVMRLLVHPYIAGYFDSFATDESVHIFMEYAAGGNLSERVKGQGVDENPFEEQQILDWFVQVPGQITDQTKKIERE